MAKVVRFNIDQNQAITASQAAREESDLFALYPAQANLQMLKAYLARDIADMQNKLALVAAEEKVAAAEVKYLEQLTRIASKFRFHGAGQSRQ